MSVVKIYSAADARATILRAQALGRSGDAAAPARWHRAHLRRAAGAGRGGCAHLGGCPPPRRRGADRVVGADRWPRARSGNPRCRVARRVRAAVRRGAGRARSGRATHRSVPSQAADGFLDRCRAGRHAGTAHPAAGQRRRLRARRHRAAAVVAAHGGDPGARGRRGPGDLLHAAGQGRQGATI